MSVVPAWDLESSGRFEDRLSRQLLLEFRVMEFLSRVDIVPFLFVNFLVANPVILAQLSPSLKVKLSFLVYEVLKYF